jgi:DNA-binding beta-propeller fold protein YncE
MPDNPEFFGPDDLPEAPLEVRFALVEADEPDGTAPTPHPHPHRRWLVPAAAAVVALAAAAVAGLPGSGADVDRPGPEGPARKHGAPVALALGSADRRVLPTTGNADLVTSARVGPGGHNMYGPYTVAYGEEGLWTTARGDRDGFRAVRLDPDDGRVLARVPLPGPAPHSRSRHGLALAGGYVWAPVRDGLLRIDARTDEAFGIVSLGGGSGVGDALTAADGVVWAGTARAGDATVRRIDAATGRVTATARLDVPGYVGVDAVDLALGDGALWASVGVDGLRHLLCFDPTTLARQRHLVVPHAGRHAAATAGNLAVTARRLLLSEAGSGGVTVVDTAAPAVLDLHDVPTQRIVDDGRRVWVVSDGALLRMETVSGHLTRRIALPTGVEDLALVDGDTYWAADPLEGRLVKLTLPGRTVR